MINPFMFIAMIAIDAAVSAGISYLFPAQGPRLKDLTISASTYGASITQAFGEVRTGGNLIWADKIIEHNKKSSAGKGGGKYINYTYTCTFAFAFCRGPITDLTRIWADSKVIFDKTGQSVNVDNTKYTFRVYSGDEDQLPDATMESIDGAGNVPGYRGLAYVLFENFLLTDFGNRIPQFAAQVSVTGTAGATIHGFKAKDTFTTPQSLMVWGSTTGQNLPNTGPYDNGYPKIDRLRGYAYVGGVHRNYSDGTAFNHGVVRINIATKTQDKNIYAGNTGIPPYSGLGWDVVPLTASTPLDRDYDPLISQLVGIGSDGSLYVHGMWAAMDGYAPYINTSPLYRLDPITYQVAATWGEYVPFSAPDGITSGSVAVGELIVSVDGTRVLHMSASTGSFSDLYDSGVINGGQITILDAKFLTFQRLLGLQVVSDRSSEAVYAGWACPLNSSDFCLAAIRLHSGIARYIDFYKSTDGAGTPFHTEDAGSGGPFFGLNWIVWDRGSPGVIWCYSTTTSGVTTNFIAKFSTDSNTVVWRTQIDSFSYLSGNSVITQNRLGYYGSTDITGTIQDAAYLIDTTVGAFLNPIVKTNNDLKLPPAFHGGVLDLVIYDLEYVFFRKQPVIDPIPWPVDKSDFVPTTVYGLGTPGQFSVWDDSRSILYYGCRENPPNDQVLDQNKSDFGFVQFSGTGGVTLADIVENILRQGGLTSNDFDLSDLESIPVKGYGFSSNSDIKSILTELRQIFLFDLVESDFILKARIRGDATPDETIDGRALGSSAAEVRDEWAATRIQEADLPAEITLGYMDVNRDYQTSTSRYRRPSSPVPVMYSQQQAALQVNLVADATTTANMVRAMIYTQWTERTKHATRLPWTYAYLDPSDLISVNMTDGRNYFERIDSQEIGADFSINTEMFAQDPGQYVTNPRIVGDGGTSPPNTLAFTSAAVPFVVNLPLLRDSDDTGGTTSRYYVGVGADGGVSSTFGGATLYVSADGESYDPALSTLSDVEWGKVGLPVPAPPRGTAGVDWETSITIAPASNNFSLESITTSQLWTGANPIIVGNEVIQFRDAVENDDGTWTISYLLRGRRGTEWACGTHVANEAVIAPAGNTLLPETEILTAAGKTFWFKAVGTGISINDVTPSQITYVLRDLMPYSVSDIRRTLASNIVITWHRRTRFGGGMIDGTGVVPLHETIESYEIYVLAAPFAGDLSLPDAPASYIRTATVSSPTWTYTSTMQTADGFDKTTDTLHLVIYQISGVVGRGFPSVRDIPPDVDY